MKTLIKVYFAGLLPKMHKFVVTLRLKLKKTISE
jgi:hypothetical protein